MWLRPDRLQVMDMNKVTAKLKRFPTVVVIVGIAYALGGCTAAGYRAEADDAANRILQQKQAQAVGRHTPFTIETPADTLRRRLLDGQNLATSGRASRGTDTLKKTEHWPEADYPKRAASDDRVVDGEIVEDEAVLLTLTEALQIGARNSRAYQTQKENVFRAALDLDLELDAFRNTYAGLISSLLSSDQDLGESVTGLSNSGELSVTRRLKSGATLGGSVAIDLVRLLSNPRESSFGILADVTVTIPLLSGSGEHIVTEPLKQAEREVIYAFWGFERFKRTFAVGVASDYLSVLQQGDQVKNAADNYRNLIVATRRARRLADADRLPPIQADQALQDELRARDRWISARDSFASAIDRFKISLGLPTDARIALDPAELTRLADAAGARLAKAIAQRGDGDDGKAQPADAPITLVEPTREFAGPYELDPSDAVMYAIESRLDLRETNGRVYDAQRFVVVAADALEAGLTLTGGATAGESRSIGSATLSDGQLRPERGRYDVGLDLDLPFERTAERNAYRDAYIQLERATRDVQELEDTIKLDIFDGLRTLSQARESYVIQSEALKLAQRRVDSTNAFLQAGRAEIRDLLEAQESLVAARDAQTAALVDYRVSELELQRDMGLLTVDERGLWREFEPGKTD